MGNGAGKPAADAATYRRFERSRVALLALIIFSGACSPEIVAFNAAPVRLCVGQSVELTWEVEGDALLAADPVVTGVGAVDSTGSRSFTLQQTTTFRLTATKRGKEAFAEQEVAALAPASERPLVLRTAPVGTTRLVARETLPAEDWDDLARVDTIVNLSDRALTVNHGGRQVVLAAPGDESDALRGTLMSGDWEVGAALLPGEEMGNPDNPPPDRLRLLVRIACTS